MHGTLNLGRCVIILCGLAPLAAVDCLVSAKALKFRMRRGCFNNLLTLRDRSANPIGITKAPRVPICNSNAPWVPMEFLMRLGRL